MDKISQLLYKRLTGSLTKAEEETLEKWINLNPYNKEAADRLADIKGLGKEFSMEEMVDTDKAYADMMRRIIELHRPKRRSSWITAAAAVALLCIGIGAGLMISDGAFDPLPQHADPKVAQADSARVFEIIKHGETKATLTTQTGQSLALGKDDTDKNLAALVQSPTNDAKTIADLKLVVPRGGEFKVLLEDSTEVWLNSESTLRYPKQFGTEERTVEVDGEAYFSVKKDAHRPFYVINSGQLIRVYGTEFNVRGYSDDKDIRTTLESGRISLSKCDGTGGEVMLSPGHQSIFNKSDQHVKLKTVNPSIYTGWRHGKFVFEEQTLAQIMKDLSRWYNFDYKFTDDKAPNLVFKGSIPRYSDLDTAIQILEASGGISFALSHDDTILISSKKRSSHSD